MRHFMASFFAVALLAFLATTTQAAEAHLTTMPCSIAGAAEFLRCAFRASHICLPLFICLVLCWVFSSLPSA